MPGFGAIFEMLSLTKQYIFNRFVKLDFCISLYSTISSPNDKHGLLELTDNHISLFFCLLLAEDDDLLACCDVEETFTNVGSTFLSSFPAFYIIFICLYVQTVSLLNT